MFRRPPGFLRQKLFKSINRWCYGSDWVIIVQSVNGQYTVRRMPAGVEYSEKTLYGDVPLTYMGSQTSLLVMTPYKMENLIYEWVDFSKFAQNWLKFKKIFEKSGDFAQNLAQNCQGRLAYEWVTFSWKIGTCMGLLSNSVAVGPTSLPKQSLSSPQAYM